jgi:ligand-binding sensor domain-containing protein
MSSRSENDFRFWTMLNGLPSDRILALAPKHGGAWVGTSSGLVFVSDTGRRTARRDVGATIASENGIRALLLTGDTLWVGSDAGLLLLPPGGDKLMRAAAATTEQRLNRPIRALARSDSTVAIATESEVFLMDLPAGRLRPRLDLTPFGTVRDIRSIAMDDRTLWIGGSFGALSYRLSDGVTRLIRPSGSYDAIEDIELTPDYIWLATADGVTRLRRLSDGSAY